MIDVEMIDIETLKWMTREIPPLHQQAWLSKAIDILREDFRQIGEMIPKEIHLSVNYPGRGVPLSLLGMHWKIDDQHYINIKPSMNGLMALDLLVHELVHVVVDELGHGGQFSVVAKAIGLDDTGSTAAAKEVLLKRLREIQEILGSYPLVTDCLEE